MYATVPLMEIRPLVALCRLASQNDSLIIDNAVTASKINNKMLHSYKVQRNNQLPLSEVDYSFSTVRKKIWIPIFDLKNIC